MSPAYKSIQTAVCLKHLNCVLLVRHENVVFVMSECIVLNGSN
jgi:hypothetical protein